MNLLTVAAVAATAIGCAVVGGIFFAFSNFIMKALDRLPAESGIAAMQSINVVVLNKAFLGVFAGTAVLSLLLSGYAVANWSAASSPWLLGGGVAYVFGSWLLTIRGNVPLNRQLAGVSPEDGDAAGTWASYLSRWTSLNSQRALGSIVAALLFIIGLTHGLQSSA
jgi:uncharacterized membrane protein